MKKLVLLIVLISIGFFACKKEKKSQPATSTGKLYPVSFNLSGFTQQILSFKRTNGLQTNTTVIPWDAGIIYYAVYDQATGAFSHFLSQTSNESNFGSIQDSLAAGSYSLVFIGTRTLIPTFNYNTTFANTCINGNLQGNSYDNWYDTFVGKANITVSGPSTDQSITMNRIVGELEVNINDAIPNDAYEIQVVVTNETNKYMIATDMPATPDKIITFDNKFASTDKGTINYKIGGIICNTTTPFTVKIICYNTARAIISQATATNITCEKNKKTTLSGNLFDNSSSNAFNVTIDSDWDPTITTVHF